MTTHKPEKFEETHYTEYQIQHMTENFHEWNTIQTYHDLEKAKKHAKDYAKNNPDIEVQIVKTIGYNY